MKRLIIFAIIAGVVFAACEMDREIKYRGDIEKNRIYVEGVLGCDADTQYVSIGTTAFFLDGANKNPLREAQATISHNSGDPQKLTFDSVRQKFMYVMPDTFAVGDTFRIDVACEGYDSVWATAVVPEPLDIYIDTVNYSFVDVGVDLLKSIEISIFIDSKNHEDMQSVGLSMNFTHYIEWQYNDYETNEPKIVTLDGAEFWCEDPIILDNSFERNFNLESDYSKKNKRRYADVLLTTSDFTSWPYEFKVWFPIGYMTSVSPCYSFIGAQARIRVYGNDYFKYLKSRSDAREANRSMFAEPMQIYSNIVNGAGHFGIAKYYQYYFYIKRYDVNEVLKDVY
jgi:hypothetical protein